ncbi:MAG: DUF222 domain-containing protein [Mycobacterium sp.]
MLANQVSDRESVLAAFDAYDSACEQLATLDFMRMTPAELFELQSRREHRARTTAVADHRILSALQAQATPKDIGARSWSEILCTRLRISKDEADRRVANARDLGPRHVIGGEVLEPELPFCAGALAAGTINSDHVQEIRKALAKAAKYTDRATCAELERDLAAAATGITPHTLREVANYALYALNQDGDGPDLAEHKRGITFGRQDVDGMMRVSGHVDAELGAYLKTITQVWGAPGVNNPADAEPMNNPVPNPLLDSDEVPAVPPEADPVPPEPPVPADSEPPEPAAQAEQFWRPDGASALAEFNDYSPEPFAQRRAALDTATDQSGGGGLSADELALRRAALDIACDDGPDTAAARDTRTKAQRNHDALKAVMRNALMSKQLGQHGGLPVTVVISATLGELQDAAGIARTSAGTMMPMRDLLRLASHAHHYLLLYKDHTAEPLYLGRTKRLASKAQRLVMISRDRGCTMPGCPVAGADCQGMHAELDWVRGGRTDITGLGLGCGSDNQLAFETGWDTTIGKDGRVHWHPPPLLDVGQDTLNHFHHPEELLIPPDEDP